MSSQYTDDDKQAVNVRLVLDEDAAGDAWLLNLSGRLSLNFPGAKSIIWH